MKIKNLFITLGLAVAATAAIGAGLKASCVKEVKEVKAVSNLTIRLTNTYSWAAVSLYAFNSNDDKNGDWPGQAMTKVYKNEDNVDVYELTLDKSYSTIVFNNNNNGQQTRNITLGSDHGFYISGDGSGAEDRTVGTYGLESTYYFYDYDNSWSNNVYCHYWNEKDNTVTGSTWPGQKMNAVGLSGNSRIYSITLDVKYNAVIFSKNGANQTADLKKSFRTQPISGRTFVIGTLSGANEWWTDLDYVYAHNFAENIMHLRDIATTDNSTTNDCASKYQLAKTTYQGFVNEGSELGEHIIGKISSQFSDAQTRLQAWATANHETFNPSTGGFSTNNPLSIIGVSNNNSTLIIVVISALVLVSTGGFFFLRKKQENE